MNTRIVFKYLKFIIYIILTTFALVIIYQKYENYELKKIDASYDKILSCSMYKHSVINFTNYYDNYYTENNEWEPLQSTLYLRYNAYFYKPESIIRVLALSKAYINEKISCLVKFEGEKIFHCLDTRIKALRSYDKYGAHAIDCKIPKNIKIDKYSRAQLYLYNHNGFRNKRPFIVDLSDTDSYPDRNSILLCSKQYNFSLVEYNNLKYWIDYSFNIGYDKIILFNNSIPYEKFYDLLNSYGEKVEIRNYKYLPYLFSKEQNSKTMFSPYFYNLKHIGQELRRAHERLAINECFSSNRRKYGRISVLDSDEIVIPRQVIMDDYKKNISLALTISNNEKDACENNEMSLASYLDDLNTASNNFFKFSYWFIYLRMMKNQFLNLFMEQLEKVIDSIEKNKNYEIEFEVKNKIGKNGYQNIKFSISSHHDFIYGKNLLDAYKFLKQKYPNFINSNSTIRFHRVLGIVVHYSFKENGKSIHFTEDVLNVGHHEVNDHKLRKVKEPLGYLSHFRNTFLYLRRSLNIRSVYLDLDHFNCFLKNEFF